MQQWRLLVLVLVLVLVLIQSYDQGVRKGGCEGLGLACETIKWAPILVHHALCVD